MLDIDAISTSRRNTWYCIIFLDTLLSCQLGRRPLSLREYSVPKPLESGTDEWELWRSEPVSSLRLAYGSQPSQFADPSTQAHGIVTPAKMLSTFIDSIELVEVMQSVLHILNDASRTESQLKSLNILRSTLETFAAKFADIVPSDNSISNVTQHRLDLCLLWHHFRLILVREL